MSIVLCDVVGIIFAFVPGGMRRTPRAPFRPVQVQKKKHTVKWIEPSLSVTTFSDVGHRHPTQSDATWNILRHLASANNGYKFVNSMT